MKPSAPRPIPVSPRSYESHDPGQATSSESRTHVGEFLSPGQPIILRLPRGLAVMLVLLLVVAVTVAFMVGRSQGYRAGQALTQQPTAIGPMPGNVGVPMGTTGTTSGAQGTTGSSTVGTPGRSTTGTPPGTTSGTTSSGTATGATAAGQVQIVELPGSADARVKGLNYFVQNESDAMARRLVQFLWINGVEAQAVERHNGRFQVIFLEGFDRAEISSSRKREYERVLKQLGKAWKAQTPGASDLEQIYLDRYDGEQELKIITAKR